MKSPHAQRGAEEGAFQSRTTAEMVDFRQKGQSLAQPSVELASSIDPLIPSLISFAKKKNLPRANQHEVLCICSDIIYIPAVEWDHLDTVLCKTLTIHHHPDPGVRVHQDLPLALSVAALLIERRKIIYCMRAADTRAEPHVRGKQ